MKEISIIIVNYNADNYIKNSIISICTILQENGVKYEVLVLDNNSQDKSLERLKDLDKNLYKLQIIESKENFGFAKGNNILVPLAKYENIILLNNDTKTVSLKNLLTVIEQDFKNTEVFTSKIYNSDMTPQRNIFSYPNIIKLIIELLLIKPYLVKRINITSKKYNQGDYYSGCFLIFKKDLFLSNNGFDEDYTFYHEECDLFFRLDKKKKIDKKILDDIIIHYGGGGEKDISDFAFKNYHAGLAIFMKKNKNMSAHLIYFIYLVGFKFRILVLKLGFDIPYNPLAQIYQKKSNRIKTEIIRLHKETLKHIKKKILSA